VICFANTVEMLLIVLPGLSGSWELLVIALGCGNDVIFVGLISGL
jgi:hypothetical protein